MHVLVKFFSKYEYACAFRKGQLYMNTLDYFWNNGFESQKDILEGVISSVRPQDTSGFPLDFLDIQLVDFQFQAVGYAFCNVFCMSTIDIIQLMPTLNGVNANILFPASMQEFGDYAVIIDNESEFLSRINSAAKKYKYLCGRVNYNTHMLSGEKMKDYHHMVLKTKETISMDKISCPSKRWDAFDKSVKYSGQKEWRICLYRGVKSVEPYTLNIGDLGDITHMIKTRDLVKEVYRLLQNLRVFSNVDSYYGNASRKELRDLFYKLGDNKAWMISTIG